MLFQQHAGSIVSQVFERLRPQHSLGDSLRSVVQLTQHDEHGIGRLCVPKPGDAVWVERLGEGRSSENRRWPL